MIEPTLSIFEWVVNTRVSASKRKEKLEVGFEIMKQIYNSGVEIVAGTDMSKPEMLAQLRRYLARLGVGKALEKAGVKPGDRVRCGNLEWEW